VIKIKNEKDLFSLLKTISRKSLNESSEIFVEKDPFVEKFNVKQKEQKGIFEQEDAADPAADEDEDSDQSDNIDDEVDKEDEEDDGLNPAAKKALDLPSYKVGQDVTFDQILTAINLVRAGNSTGSKATKQEIKDYFERLDKEEKGVLLIYLKELAKIMTGAIEGDKAQDPSDPTTFFDIIVKKDAPSGSDDDQSAGETSQEKPAAAKQIQPKQGDLEDTTPPIKVNEAQDFSVINRKIKLINN
jgi:hypothetical protein